MKVVINRQNCAITNNQDRSDHKMLAGISYLLLMEDGAEAVEQLERSEDLALHQNTGDDCRCGPPSRAHGHLEEPLLERQLAQCTISTANDGGHAAREGRCCRSGAGSISLGP